MSTCTKYPEFLANRVGRYYRERVQDTWRGGHILKGKVPGPDALHLSSCDYLSLYHHPLIAESMCENIQSKDNVLLQSPKFVTNSSSPELQLEDKFAVFMQSEASILCQSGYVANVGLVQSIASSHTPVYIDILSHMSLLEGIKSAGAKAIRFRHNSVQNLEELISRHGKGIVLLVSVHYSDGEICPLEEIANLCQTYDCILVVDESHSMGTHGPGGAGLVVDLNLVDRVHFRTASLGKAFASRAGIIACSKQFQEYFKCESYPYIFSTGVLPHDVRALGIALTIIEKEDWRRDRLRENSKYVRDGLRRLGYKLNSCDSQIIALESGPEKNTLVLRDALESQGIFGSVFFAPATPTNRSLIRLSMNSGLNKKELDKIITACRSIRQQFKSEDWPSLFQSKSERAHVFDISNDIFGSTAVAI